MPTYEFRCKMCDRREESARTDHADNYSCRECMGPLVRVWSVNVGIVPGGYKDSNRG